jgi:hypothetical protein
MLVSLVTQRPHWTVMLRQRIIVRSPMRSDGTTTNCITILGPLNVIHELPDGVPLSLGHVGPRVSISRADMVV